MTRTARIAFSLSVAAALLPAAAAHAVEWPKIPGQGTDWVNSLNEPQWPSFAAQVERRFASPWAFEVGARYWYSTGTTKFGFTNGIYGYGSPTSTLDWNKTQGHSGEVFARIDHRPSSLFVKAVVGGGSPARRRIHRSRLSRISTGRFPIRRARSAATISAIATIDFGYSYELPRYGVRFGGFVGYHYWREKMTAYGSGLQSRRLWPA